MTDETITYRLSTIDQSIIRTYIRYCLCFPCSDDDGDRQQLIANLTKSTKRAISHLPILAGTVTEAKPVLYKSKDDFVQTIHRQSNGGSLAEFMQKGRMEVRLTLDQLNDFEPTVKILTQEEFPYSYEFLSESNMPASAFIGDALTPLPDMPDPANGGNPAFSIQANFIEDGVIVALYLHHSVADIQGMASVIRYMSISEDILPARIHTVATLQQDAQYQSQIRDRLSGSRGVKESLVEHPEYNNLVPSNGAAKPSLAPSQGVSRILSFDLEMLDTTRDMINERLQYQESGTNTHLSAFDCLTGMLWKAITRARWPPGTAEGNQVSALLHPVSIRKRIDPPLEANFCGNACLFSYCTSTITRLGMPFDISTIQGAAHLVRGGIQSMTEPKVRSAIALINTRDDVRSVNHPRIDFENDVFITSWADLPVGDEAGLGLGLGPPEFARKPSRHHSAYGCNLLPLKKEEGIWGVLVQLSEDAMERLLEDPGLKRFVVKVA